MTPPSPPPPSDDEIDRLLAALPRDPSPEFERRWRELRASLAVRPAVPARCVAPRLLWPGLVAGALAAALVVAVVREGTPSRPAPVDDTLATFETLVALDVALAPGAVLLEPETRDAVLHLPAEPGA